MEPQANLRQQARSAFAAYGYVHALHVQAEADIKLPDPRPGLEELGKKITVLAERGDQIAPWLQRLARGEVVSDHLHGLLISLLDCVDGLRELISSRDSLTDACPVAAEYWTAGLQERLAAQADRFEEYYNELALKRGALEAVERQLAAYVAATAGTEADLDRDLEAASIVATLAAVEVGVKVAPNLL